MTLSEAILMRVNENSGGIKLTALVVDLIVMNAENQIEPKFGMSPEFADTVIKLCEDMPKIGLLDYAMPLGDDGLERVKTFVYTPLTA